MRYVGTGVFLFVGLVLLGLTSATAYAQQPPDPTGSALGPAVIPLVDPTPVPVQPQGPLDQPELNGQPQAIPAGLGIPNPIDWLTNGLNPVNWAGDLEDIVWRAVRVTAGNQASARRLLTSTEPLVRLHGPWSAVWRTYNDSGRRPWPPRMRHELPTETH